MLRHRRKQSLATLLALCGLALLAPAAGSGAASRTAQTPPLGGVNVGGLEIGSTPGEAASAINLARQLHAKVVRFELRWAVMEPNGPGKVDPRALAYTDRLFAEAAGAGIGVIAVVRSSPCWATAAPAALARSCSPTRLGDANRWGPSDPATYARFVAYLAQRYGTRLAAIELWNEPDQSNELYFAGPEKAKRYAALVRAAYPAIKQANPAVRVIAGSLVGNNGAFLRALYAAGFKGFYDGLAVHYYTLTLASVRAIHQVQLQNGDTAPLWLDEFGWSTCWPRRIQEQQACVTSQVQRANVVNIFRSLAGAPYVAADVLFQLSDTREEQFGLVAYNGKRKPAFGALAGVLASPLRRASPVTLRLRRHGGRIVASGSGPVGDYMQLEAFKRGVLRYRAVFVLDRFNRYSIRLPRVLGTRGLRVRTYQFWTGPAGAAQKKI